MNDSLELRKALISFYEQKGQKIHFLVNFEIAYVYVYYIEHNDQRIRVVYINPKVNKKKVLVLGFNTFYIRKCMGDLALKDKFEKCSSYKEPYPGAWYNDTPWSRKKQKPNKRK